VNGEAHKTKNTLAATTSAAHLQIVYVTIIRPHVPQRAIDVPSTDVEDSRRTRGVTANGVGGKVIVQRMQAKR